MALKKFLRVNQSLCTGCRQCELACSLTKYGVAGMYRASIKVSRLIDQGGGFLVTICRHCKEAKCLHACPVEGALKKNESAGALFVDQSLCIGCRLCAEACPFGAIQIGPGGEILKCDLCGGSPACVEVCSKSHRPKGVTALEYLDAISINSRVKLEKTT